MCTDDSGRTEQFERNFPSKCDVNDGLRLRSYLWAEKHLHLPSYPIMAIAD
ncbi:hypothetical protein [Nostoc sp.]|uniref:hypothetical protein n=1 Tax=Nostoc sp. TaxID=1180 RepID=UPI002FFB5905